MKQRLYIDVNSGLGRTSYRHERIPYKVNELVDDMEYFRIHSAVVYSNIARDYSFVKGNSILIDDIKENNRLYGAAVVIPDIKTEVKEGHTYFDYLCENGIKAFKLYPKFYGHGFDPFYLGDLSEYMIEKQLPLIIDIQEVDWRDLRSVLDAFPNLNVVLCNTSWATNRFLFPLMEKYRNLYFDLSSNQAFSILDTCKRYFGIEHVLFGTGYPNKSMGGIKALVEYSCLTDHEKDMVSYINAKGLFNIDIPGKYNNCRLDEIALKMDCGMPLDGIDVIDSHAHIVDKEHIVVSEFQMIDSDEDGLVKKMDMLGIDKTLICPWEGLVTDGISANKTSLNVMKKYKDRFGAYAMCNPNYPEDMDKLLEFNRSNGFIGTKPYFYYNKYDLLGEKYDEWFEYSNKHKMIMLVHSGMQGIAGKAGILSRKYPDIPIILAHSGASYETADENISVAKQHPNIYLEITYTSITNNIIEYMVDEIGAHRILFGTDMPMRDPSPQLAWVCYAKISVEDKKKIIGGNIQRLLTYS